jgi:HTH-type transcriptional regulator / antitoxin HipB
MTLSLIKDEFMDYIARTPEQLGTLLKSCRTQRKDTQQAVGARVGLKQSTVSAIEADAGRTTVLSLYKLLSSLDLELVIRDRKNGQPAPERDVRDW